MEQTAASRTAARERLTDALTRVAGGDRSALRTLYSLTSAKLFGICLRICQDNGGAEDVLQEVYVKVWQRAGRFDPARASPITWLAAIARNAAIDWRRAQAPRREDALDPALVVADDRPLADAQIEADEDGARMSRCLDTLERQIGQAIRAAFFGGLTYAQLAQRDGVPLGTMKTWIRRGLMQLRTCLADG